MDKIYTVYKLVSPNGKIYVGMTSRPVEKRWGHDGNQYSLNKNLYADIKLYGWDNFQHLVVKTGLTKGEAETLEEKTITDCDSTKPDKGYNIAYCSTSKGLKASQETRKKQSMAKIGKHHEWTEEARKKLSETKKGMVFTEEHRRKLSEAQTGKKHPYKARNLSAEERERRRIARMGIAPANKGVPMSEEQKRKVSDALKGKLAGANNPSAKRVQVYKDGRDIGTFDTLKDAIETIGKGSRNALSRAMKNGNKYLGYEFHLL